MNTKSKNTKATTTGNMFVATIQGVRLGADANTVGIFKAASMVSAMLPEKLPLDGTETPSMELLGNALSSPEARSAVRRFLVAMIPGAPIKSAKVKGSKTKNSGKSLQSLQVNSNYTADVQNVDRALHVAAIVASKSLGASIQTGNWNGAEFSISAEAFAKAHGAEFVSGEKRIIFGKSKPDSIMVREGDKFRLLKCSFANLAAAFPKVKASNIATRSSKAITNNVADTCKAMRQFLGMDAFSPNEQQREELSIIRNMIDAKLGIVTKSAPKRRKPAAKAA